MKRRTIGSFALPAAALLVGALASAEADGPDFYDVRDGAAGDALAMRSEPSAEATTLGDVPPGATCLANRDCVGGLTLEEATTLPARLYALASASGDAPAQEQQAWAARREACAAEAKPGACARRRFLERIAWLRTSSKAARSEDDRGISSGPVVYRCEQTDGLLGAFFVRTDPGLGYAQLRDASWVCEAVLSGSGSRYAGRGGEDELLWTKGDGARFRAGSASPEVDCQVEPIG